MNYSGRRIKIISGFRGQDAVNIAMERREVDSSAAPPGSSVKATMRPDGGAQDQSAGGGGTEPIPRFPIMPGARADTRRVLQFIGSGAAFGRPLLARPGPVPPERVAILRQAFDRTMANYVSGRGGEVEHGDQAGWLAQRSNHRHRGSASPPQGLARAKELIGSAQ